MDSVAEGAAAGSARDHVRIGGRVKETLYENLSRRIDALRSILDKPKQDAAAKAAADSESRRRYDEVVARQKAEVEYTKPRVALFGLSRKQADEIVARRDAVKQNNA